MPAKLKPGTVAHFKRWARNVVLDTGTHCRPEDFQLSIVDDILNGRRQQVWVVIPQGNTKTTTMALVALYHLDPEGWGVRRPMVVVAAATREQAHWLYLQASGMVRDSPKLRGRFICQEGFRRIKLPEDDDEDPRGRIQIWAGGDKEADGAIYTLAILDELHNHVDLRLYRRWRGKLRKRKDARLIAISTAGVPAGDFEETRARLIREATTIKHDGEYGAHIRAVTPTTILHDWAVRSRDDIDDIEVVKAANPFKAITLKDLRTERGDETMTDSHWLRFTCNIAARIDGVAITPEMWEDLREDDLDVDPSIWTCGGWDHAWDEDCAALVVIGWESSTRRPVCETRIFEPPVKEEDIIMALAEMQLHWGWAHWAFDPAASARHMVKQLEKGEHPLQGDAQFEFVEVGQQNEPMALAASRLDEAIRRGYLPHDGDAGLRKHALTAVKQQISAEKWRFARPAEAKSRRREFPIDALSALLFAMTTAVDAHDEQELELAIAFA